MVVVLLVGCADVCVDGCGIGMCIDVGLVDVCIDVDICGDAGCPAVCNDAVHSEVCIYVVVMYIDVHCKSVMRWGIIRERRNKLLA